MKRLAAIVVCGFLSACDSSPKVELSTAEWVCSKVATVDRMNLVPAGKAAVPIPSSKLECVQWSKMGETP